MNNKLRGKSMDSLFQAILHLNTLEECSNFFEDLCTISELRAMEQRFQVAAMLDEGRFTVISQRRPVRLRQPSAASTSA